MSLIACRPTAELIGIVQALGGRWHGGVAMCRCPAHDDRTPSLSLRQGERAILVTCFAGCAPGTVLRAIHALRAQSGETRHELAGPGWSPATSDAAVRLWSRAAPVAGTRATAYLQARGLGTLLPDLRFLARCPFGPRPRTRFLPALLVGVRAGSLLVAVQRIVLRGDGQRGPKRLLGAPGVGAWRGADPADGRLAIAEGFETAAAFTQLTGTPAWASLGARRLGRIGLPADLSRLEIVEDNDAEGARSAAAAAAAYARPGLTIVRRPPPRAFNDWADMLRAETRGEGTRS